MASTSRAILHVDMDAFFAAVEVLDDPTLRGKPVIVGGTPEGRGVVSTASYEARRFGVRSAMSAAKAHRLCPHGVFLRPRIERYSEISEQVFEILGSVTPQIEAVSIDEGFLDVTASQALFGDPVAIARRIKDRIRAELGLTASVGVSPNKFLAKVASDLEKPDGLVVLGLEDAERVLGPLPAGRLMGVGKVAEERLARAGIRTVAEVRAASVGVLEAAVGSFARTLRELAHGRDDRPVVSGGGPKSIGAETTFARDLGDDAELVSELDGLADEVGRRLRAQGYRGRTITLKAKFPDFSLATRATTLRTATAATARIRSEARRLLRERLERGDRPLRLLGIQVSHLEPEVETQASLFGPDPDRRSETLDRVADRIRARFGDRAAGRASAMAGDPFEAIRGLGTLMAGFPRPWFVAGGWAVDLWLGRRTRDHADLEIAVARDDQEALREHLAGWTFEVFLPGTGGKARSWAVGERLEMPIHELRARPGRGLVVPDWPPGRDLEVLLNECAGREWRFRRDPRVAWPLPMGAARTRGGLPALLPEIVLLYKSNGERPKDQADFESLLPTLPPARRARLAEALATACPGHPWVAELAPPVEADPEPVEPEPVEPEPVEPDG